VVGQKNMLCQQGQKRAADWPNNLCQLRIKATNEGLAISNTRLCYFGVPAVKKLRIFHSSEAQYETKLHCNS